MTGLSALEAANTLLEDVNSLLDHHPAQQDPKPGRPAGSGYGPLLRASVALCYTAWEVYVEEALVETVEWLLNNRSPDELPDALRSWASDQSGDPWTFAGDSWRESVVSLVRKRIDGDDQGRYGFNTANVPSVESLYNSILGVQPLQVISWQKKSASAVRKSIELLVKERGEIVHKGTTPGDLNLAAVRAWADFVRRLTEKFEAQMTEFRHGTTSENKTSERETSHFPAQ